MNGLPDTVSRLLDVLGQRFGATGAHLWSVVVRQEIIGSIVSLIGWGGFFVALTYACKRASNSEWVEACDEPGVVRGCLAFAGVCSALIAITVIGIDIQGLLNPEYYALHDLMDALK